MATIGEYGRLRTLWSVLAADRELWYDIGE
jgi:hypothetical protein